VSRRHESENVNPGRIPEAAANSRFTPTTTLLGSSPCHLQVHRRTHRVSNKGRRFSMPRQSECNLPWSARSSAACRTHWGPTPRAHLASFRELAGPSVSSVRSSNIYVWKYINEISALFTAAMGATFAATESIVANQRETQDALNGVAGGCAAGFLAGIRGACHCSF
jgi:hypothetical protein